MSSLVDLQTELADVLASTGRNHSTWVKQVEELEGSLQTALREAAESTSQRAQVHTTFSQHTLRWDSTDVCDTEK